MYAVASAQAIMALLIYVPLGILVALSAILILGPIGMLIAALVMGLALVGLWCLIVLMNKEVREGFKERAEELSY